MKKEELKQLSEVSTELFLLSDTFKALETLSGNYDEKLPPNALYSPVKQLCELTEKLDCLVKMLKTGKEQTQ